MSVAKTSSISSNQAAPIVFHIPHASTLVPADVRQSLIVSDAELDAELLLMTDMHTDVIFGAAARSGDAIVKFPVSRLVVDPERFIEDADEPMAARGMGVVYTRRHDGRPLRANLADKERLVREFYDPHHAALLRTVEDHLATHGKALILDCHSFPSQPLPYELDQSLPRPEICIGTDALHTPDPVRNALIDAFEALGYVVGVNAPFAGTIVPSQHFGRDNRVASAMIELRRDLYMDEATGTLAPRARKMTLDVVKAIKAVRGFFTVK